MHNACNVSGSFDRFTYLFLVSSQDKKSGNMFGKRLNAGVSKSRVNASSSSVNLKGSRSPDIAESTVAISYIKIQDNAKLLPKYTAALSRPKDEFLPAEDLDVVQSELELLLSNVAQRNRVLKAEYEAIEKEDRKDRKSKLVERPPISPGKRKRLDEKKHKDKLFPSLKIAKKKYSASQSPALTHNADESLDALPHTSSHSQRESKLIPKNDVPNKFWLSVEPYCMPITNEDLKLLEDLMEQYSGPLVPPIPDLGPHYTTVWATDDLREEADNSNVNLKSKCRTNPLNNDIGSILKKGERVMGEAVTGPLTQRLVSVLMEENLLTEGLSNVDSTSSSENSSSTFRSIQTMKNGICIERRLKKELIEQGILDTEEYGKNQEDEVLAEIKRVLTELSAIAEYNSAEVRRLYTSAKVELKRLDVKRKLDNVDQEIIETYKKVLVAKQKRRALIDQEKGEIFRLTEEQKNLSDQLEEMAIPGPNYID